MRGYGKFTPPMLRAGAGLGQGWGWLDYATLSMMGGAAAELEQSWGRAGQAGLQQEWPLDRARPDTAGQTELSWAALGSAG